MAKLLFFVSSLVLAIVASAFGTGALCCADMVATMLLTCPAIICGGVKSGIIEW